MRVRERERVNGWGGPREIDRQRKPEGKKNKKRVEDEQTEEEKCRRTNGELY